MALILRGRATRPPNVLIIVVDTCRGDRCGFNGYGRKTTRALGEFAKDAVTFTDAWTPGPWTGPAHASLFTGLRPTSHGFMEGSRLYLDEGFETIAERLSAVGYKTAAFSNNPVVSQPMKLVQGFQEFTPMYELLGETSPTADPTHAEALHWIKAREAAGERWFTFINHMEPHLPYRPTAEVRQKVGAEGFAETDIERATDFQPPLSMVHGLGQPMVDATLRKTLSRLYDGEVEIVDAEIGRFLDSLREMGVLDHTLVVITADHGENLGDHGLFDHRMSLHRTLLHIPLIVRLPGVFDGGDVERRVVRLEDVAPTVYALCSTGLPAEMQGESLTAGLDGRIARAAHGTLERFEGPLRLQFPSIDTHRLERSIRSVYDGRFHLIRYVDGATELYDVTADPDELDDLSARRPDEIARLSALDQAD